MQKIIVLMLTLLGLIGCSAYKLEVQQGNVVTEEQLAQLETGMNKRQVIFLLGSPLLRDPFHQERWDYPYLLRQDGKRVDMYSVSLYFEGDRLERFEQSGDLPEDAKAVIDSHAG